MRMVVNIDVPELAPAIAFYGKAFGLTLNRVLDDDVAEMVGASAVIYLLAAPDGSAPHDGGEVRRYSRHWTPVHIDFVVDDIAAAARRVVEAGAREESECVEWRGSKCITFSDPFGHGFCLLWFEKGTYAGSRPTSG